MLLFLRDVMKRMIHPSDPFRIPEIGRQTMNTVTKRTERRSHPFRVRRYVAHSVNLLVATLLLLPFVVSCEQPDIEPPVITVSIREVNVIGGVSVRTSGNQLSLGDKIAASWTDNSEGTCTASLSLGGTPVSSGATLKESGNLLLKVTDEAGNSATATIILTKEDSGVPTISVKIQEKNVIAGVATTIRENQLLFDNEVAASWTDDYTTACKTELTLTPEGTMTAKTITSGAKLLEAGTLRLTVTDDFDNKATADFTLSSVAVFGLENLQNLSLQVDQTVNLLEGITLAEGLSLLKVEMEQDGKRTEITNPKSFISEYPITINIILTLKRPDSSTIEVRVDNLVVKPLTYDKLSIEDLKPVDILPVIGQVTNGDPKVYDYIEHLRIAEATVIRDMMWEYGAGEHSKEQYQQLMGRLNTGMFEENPLGYDNYEILGTKEGYREPGNHAHCEWFILNTLVRHVNYIIPFWETNPYKMSYQLMLEYVKANPNTINVFGQSSCPFAYTKGRFDQEFIDNTVRDHEGEQELYNCKNYIHFAAGTNIEYNDGILLNKLYNGEYESDENGYYSTGSLANSDKNNRPESHLLVTIATDKTGDIKVDEPPITGTKYPVGFADNILFAGRIFPYHSMNTGEITASDGKYATSFTNYLNVAMMDICFQLYAEVKDVDELLEMVRSTALTDYVSLEGKRQPLILINHAGFIKKYLMAGEQPQFISFGKTAALGKGYYKGVVYDIPGAEIKVDGQWIPVSADNTDRIQASNPFIAEWRINGDLLRKMGYTLGETVEGRMLLVDDQWNGLRLEIPVNLQIKG